MVKQVITCKNKLGNIEISINYNTSNLPFCENEIKNNQIELENVPIKQNDNQIPLIYAENTTNSVRIFLLEDLTYKIRFIPKKGLKDYETFTSLKKHSQNIENKKLIFTPYFSKNEGEITFNSYVGKTFIDIRKGEKTLISIPIEIRSRKINYQKQYPKMISDLSQKFYQIIYDSNSPLFNNYETKNEKYESKYELFMYLEYLFENKNLPQTFEYLSNNLNSKLKTIKETVPLSLATNITPNEMINIITKPENLTKTNNPNTIFPKNLKNYIPQEIQQTKYTDTIDTIENRFYKYFLKIINYLIIDLKKYTKPNTYVSDRLETFNYTINEYLSQKYFHEINTMEYPPLNSQILQKKEGYKDILEYYALYEYAFKINLKNISNEFKGYEKKLNQLYEYWALIKIIEILSKITNTPQALNKILLNKNDKFNFDLKHGTTTEIKFNPYQNTKISLFYNLTFYPKKRGKNNQTYSIELRPDYTLQIITQNQKQYFLHFDAKYKKDKHNKGKHKNEDINKMHTYKDAIYHTEGAYILYPGDKNKHTIFKEKENNILPSVGAFSLNPGGPEYETKSLEEFIQKAINELTKNS